MNMTEKYQYRKLADINKLEDNPRFIKDDQFEKLCESLRNNPDYFQARPIILSDRTGELVIIAGNRRYDAAMAIGMDEVPTFLLSGLTLERENEIIIRDNVSNGEWDMDLLENLWDVDLLKEWGLELPDFEVDEVLEAEEDDYTESPDKIETDIVIGDLFEIGHHRLLCGDSTDPGHVDRLMGGATPDLIHTDPPYGMNAVSKSGVLSKNYSEDIIGDDNPDIAKDAFNLIYSLYPDAKHVWWGANYYCSVLPDSECWLVWDKNNGESDQTDCELAWANFRSVVRQFTQASEKTNRVHPTQKPVSLVSWIVKKFKLSTIATIADYFGGSGVTMVTAHQLKMKSFLMEYDPKYCQVIVDRMMQFDPALVIKKNGEKIN